VSNFFKRADISKDLLITKRILEPCVGTGNFVIATLIWLYENNATENNINKFLENLYVSEVSDDSLTLLLENLSLTLKELFNMELDYETFKNNIFNGICLDINQNNELEIHDSIKKLPKFDLIITNPPYRNLRAEIKHYEASTEYNNDKNNYVIVKDFIKNNYEWSSKGNLN